MVKPKKKGKPFKVRYTPIGDSISPESTFVQAAIALDVAAQFAVKAEDAEQMNRTAELWIDMSRALMGIEGEEDPPPTNRDPLGFTMIKTDKESEDGRRIDTEDSDESQSDSSSRNNN